MLKPICHTLATSMTILAIFIPVANAADVFIQPDIFPQPQDNSFSFSGSIGILALEAKEYVFDGTGSSNTLSLLTWQSTAPLLKLGFNANFYEGWTIAAKSQIAMSGNSYMDDFDWLLPFRPGFASNEWTDRSIHEDTNLDWFFNSSIALGKNIDMGNGFSINLNAGAKYTDVQWAARGGDYVYSTAGFRDSSGSFADTAGISYRQQLPSAFVGLDTKFVKGDITFDLGAQAGMTFLASATDWHWMRTPPLRFVENVNPAPTLAATGGVSYKVHNDIDIFFEGSVEKIFFGRSDTTVYNNDTNANLGFFNDSSGAELLSASASFGLRGKF